MKQTETNKKNQLGRWGSKHQATNSKSNKKKHYQDIRKGVKTNTANADAVIEDLLQEDKPLLQASHWKDELS